MVSSEHAGAVLRRRRRRRKSAQIIPLPRFNTALFCFALIALHAAFFWLFWQLFASAPAVHLVKDIRISPPQSGTGISLGWMELGQRPSLQSADRKHLQLRFDGENWHLSNIAAKKKIDVQTTRYPQLLLKRARLYAGATLLVGSSRLYFDRVEPGHLAWTDSYGVKGAWRGGRLLIADEPVKSDYCYADTPLSKRFKRGLQQYFSAAAGDREHLLLHLGGGVSCNAYGTARAARWALASETFDSARITRRGDAYYFAPGRAPAQTTLAIAQKGSPPLALSAVSLPFASEAGGRITRLIIGRTYYQVEQDLAGSELILRPERKQDAWRQPPAHIFTDAEIVWQPPAYLGAGLALRNWLREARDFAGISLNSAVVMLAFASALCFAAIIWGNRCGALKISPLTGIAALFPAALCIALALTEKLSGAALALHVRVFITLAAWAWASGVLLMTGALRCLAAKAFWFSGLAIAFFGMFTLTQLSVGADTTKWLASWSNHMLLAAGVPFLAVLIGLLDWGRLLPGAYWLTGSENRRSDWLSRLIVLLFAGGLIVLGLLLALTGRESGTVLGIQPTELFKWLLVIAFARYALIVRESLPNPSAFYAILRYTRAALGLTLLICVIGSGIFLWVGDLSPILIAFLFLLLALAELGRPRQAQGNPLLVSARWLFVSLFGIIAWGVYWLGSEPQALIDAEVTALLPNIERFLVWSNPRAYPELGFQQLLSFRRIAETGLYGASSWFGANETALAVPAVQDDFILTFVLHKFGGFSGLFLLALQAVYIGACLKLRQRLNAFAVNQDIPLRIPVFALAAVIYASTLLIALHWLISWSNVLGLLPVMGQPATWISFAPSHLAFVGLPALAAALIGCCIARDADNEYDA